MYSELIMRQLIKHILPTCVRQMQLRQKCLYTSVIGVENIVMCTGYLRGNLISSSLNFQKQTQICIILYSNINDYFQIKDNVYALIFHNLSNICNLKSRTYTV